MYRINSIILSTFFFFLLLAPPLHAGWFPWSSTALFTIDGEEYSPQDFKDWWQNWQEEGMQFPETPNTYIEWSLLFKEAEKMRLYEDPAYHQKALTFLKARTLMLLKAEEVDLKIKISDEDLWQRYLKDYAPQYQLSIYFFKDETDAQKFIDKLGSLPLDATEFTEKAKSVGGFYTERTEWYRPLTINPGWIPIINELKKGTMSPPTPWKNNFVVLRLQDKLEGNLDDLNSVRDYVFKAIWKDEETRLTIELLKRLREKYKVTINSERLKELDISLPIEEISDEPIITTSNGDISEKIVAVKLKQLHRFRRNNGFQQDTSFQFKNRVVNGIIDQTLTSWEGLARGYEKKPPFEAVYKFYCQHQMVKILEHKLFTTNATVTDEEIKEYYEKNAALFTQPEVIRMVIVEGSTAGLNSLWLEVALGGDFRLLARKATGHDIPVRDLPVDHINPKVKEVLDKLTVDEVSEVFTVDGHVTMVQLIERRPAQIKPLAEVRESIRTQLKAAKFKKLRQEYINKLKEQYTIEIDNSVWQKLKEELEQLNEKN